MSRLPLRFFPDSGQGRHCYRLPTRNLSLVLVRPRFVYKNYDGKSWPPAFSVSIGTATVAFVNLSWLDPWVEEFVWKVKKESLSFCLLSTQDGGFPVISSLEVRPLPDGAYGTSLDEFANNLLKKRFRINCGYSGNGSLR